MDRPRLLEKTNSDSSNKRSRIPPVLPSRNQTTEKKVNTTLTNSVGVLSSPNDDSSGPWTGEGSHTAAANHSSNDSGKQNNVVAALAPHTSTAMPVASYGLPTQGKSSGNASTSNSSSSSASSSAKQFLTRRVRSHSKTDSQSVSDKSLFSRFFPKKPKKPIALITTNAKSIDVPLQKQRPPLINQLSLKSSEPQSTIDEEENEDDEPNISTGSMSDDEQNQPKKNEISATRSSTTSRAGSRTNSGNAKATTINPTPNLLPGSDSDYYASMSSAPKGFSISYHKCSTKGNDYLRKQAAFGRFQQQQLQSKQSGSSSAGGASQLMVGLMSQEE